MLKKTVNFCELPDVLIVKNVRAELILRMRNALRDDYAEKVDFSDLCYTYCDAHKMRHIDLGFNRGSQDAGFFVVDFDDSQKIKMYGSCVIIDGSVFEFISYDEKLSKVNVFFNTIPLCEIITEYDKDIPVQWNVYSENSYSGKLCTGDFLLLGKWLWLPKGILKNYINFQTNEFGCLRVNIDRRDDTLFDFIISILKLVTLYGLWCPQLLKNDDYVLPEKMKNIPKNFQLLYFAINLCFRGIYFDSCFGSRSGP